MNKLLFLLLLGFVSCTQKNQSVEHESNPIRLRVMGYNIGDFSGSTFSNGSDIGRGLIRYSLLKQKADLIGLQEDVPCYGEQNPGDVLFDMYEYYYREGSSMYNYKAFASDYPISNVRPVYYYGMSFGHPYFLTGQLNLEGNRDVQVVSFHFDWADNSRRRKQIQQLIDYTSDYDYVILMGDTNSVNYINGESIDDHHLLYDVEWRLFKDAGFQMANNGSFGVFNTYVVGEGAPIDNIFVKGRISMNDAFVCCEPWMNDHCMLISDLLIY